MGVTSGGFAESRRTRDGTKETQMHRLKLLVALAIPVTACSGALPPCARFEEPLVEAEINDDDSVERALSVYSDGEVVVDGEIAARGFPPLPDSTALFVPEGAAVVSLGVWSPSSPDDHHYGGHVTVSFDGRPLLVLRPAFSFGGQTEYRVAVPGADAQACQGAEGENAIASVIAVQTQLETTTLAAKEELVTDEGGITFLYQALAAEVFDCVGTLVEGQTCARGQILQRRIVRRP